jgi:hypothetical protein
MSGETMTFPLTTLRVAILPLASFLFIIGVAAFSPARAGSIQAASDAEYYVLEQLRMSADVFIDDHAVASKRELRGEFLAALLTGSISDLKIDPHGIVIIGGVITSALDLRGKEIPYDVSLHRMTFNGAVELNKSHFAKGLAIIDSTFNGPWVAFDDANIALDLVVGLSVFEPTASFNGTRTGGDFIISGATFKGDGTSFSGVRVGGAFAADGCHFFSEYTRFDEMRVEGDFSAEGGEFSYREGASREKKAEDPGKSEVSFAGSHFANFSLAEATFDMISSIDLTRMQADFISFDSVKSLTPSEVKNQRMIFKMLSPVNKDDLKFLLSPYNAEFYTELEASWRTHGYPDEADNIYIAKKRAERRENCKSFWHQCNTKAWAGSMFLDLLAGYGKSLQNLLYWSLVFLFLGMFVFRSERGMRTKDWNKAPQYAGKYNALWYSLDLFLPIIKLGESDVWTPRDNRSWANLYKKIHTIIGSLFVPIGLAALTGIIK